VPTGDEVVYLAVMQIVQVQQTKEPPLDCDGSFV